jgi:hypothetical protein
MKNKVGSMSKLRPKKQSLIAFLVIAAIFPLFALLDRIVPPEWASLKETPLLLMGLAFFLAGRIRCPHCGNRVVGPGWGGNPAPLVLLWMVTEKCSKCAEPLDW